MMSTSLLYFEFRSKSLLLLVNASVSATNASTFCTMDEEPALAEVTLARQPATQIARFAFTSLFNDDLPSVACRICPLQENHTNKFAIMTKHDKSFTEPNDVLVSHRNARYANSAQISLDIITLVCRYLDA